MTLTLHQNILNPARDAVNFHPDIATDCLLFFYDNAESV